jgi:hypothetical protein
MKVRDAILLLFYADNCKPLTSKLHLKYMLKLVFDYLQVPKDERESLNNLMRGEVKG